MPILDSDNSVFFARELENVKARTYDVQYADLQYRNLIPVSNEAGAGATSITFQTFDHVGLAQIISNYAGDLPRSDVSGKETTIPVRTIGASFGYNVKEIKSSRMVGRSLDQRRANASRRSIEEKMNDIAYFGDAQHGLLGIFTHPNIPVIDAIDIGGGVTEWENKDPDQILDDINLAFGHMFETTLMKEQANTLILSPKKWNYVSSKRIPGINMTIKQFIVANSPFITDESQIIPVNEINNASLRIDAIPDGEDFFMVYNRNPDKLQFEVPEDIVFYDEQEHNLEMVVPVSAECAGVNIYYPLSLLFCKGI